MAVVVVFVFFFAVVAVLAAAGGATAAFVEHTFVVSQVTIRHLCKDTEVTVVNGQLPGPTIEVTQGDSVTVHVINKSPHGLSIHWHGVKQQLNCWADGVGMITQCPIQPNKNFTYRFVVADHEGTLWWHAHVAGLRATIHGAIIIRPKPGASLYPFPKPDKEIPIFIGEWWQMDLVHLIKRLNHGFWFDEPVAATINGKLGDLYNCSGVTEDNYIMNVEQGKTYMLRIVNAALFSEYYFKIAGHRFTVVAVDANYVKPFTTDIIAIAPGETVDALLVADAPHGSYYMVALANQPPKPALQIPLIVTRGMLQYHPKKGEVLSDAPMAPPEMPDQHDEITSFYFHGNLTSLPHPRLIPVPTKVDRHLYLALDAGNDDSINNGSSSSSDKKSSRDRPTSMVMMMNNISFQLPSTVPLLEGHYYDKMSNIDMLQELPDKAPRMFNYSNRRAPTSKATLVKMFPYNTTVEIVFQSPVLADSYSNPMHLHGHDFFVLAQGLGRYEAKKDVKKYNLVDPPMKNTVQVPFYGWAVIRFVTTNPGVWFLHCHYENHASTGMAVALVVKNGPTVDTTLPPPPSDLPKCNAEHNVRVAYE